jgi:formylglycine-generating enzyme required for sulfatase activity
MIEVLGDYTIVRQLGKGAFGSVYLAEHRFIRRFFALKVLPEEIGADPAFARRFEQEVAAIAALDHPHIVKIHNVSYSEGYYFLVMDPIIDSFQETLHLDRYLQSKGKFLTEEEKEALLRQVAQALDYSHEQGVVHGAMKLSNILVQPKEGGKIHLLLSDFGITRLIGEGVGFVRLCSEMAQALLPGAPLGKETLSQQSRQLVRNFAFLAPEQKLLDGTSIDAKADVFAFGILAYYLLCGKTPEGCFEPPSKWMPDAKGNWDLLLSRCLQNAPHARPSHLTSAMNTWLKAPPSTATQEPTALEKIGDQLETHFQMSFDFPPKSEEESEGEGGEGKPILQPPEMQRPEFEIDPGAIFQRELLVSQYIPKTTIETKAVEPILTEMVVIAKGSYWRGSREGARDEMPRHAVQITSFALDIHPVTNEQFLLFLQAMGGEKDQHNNDIIRLRDSRIKRSAGKLTIESGYARHPVVGVTWYGAVAYAKWIGKRLPTEAEWEAAASANKENFLFPTGIDIDRTQANFFSSDTTPVMSYPPNAFGLYDMAGNVYEWCQDWYAYNSYEISALEPNNPQGPQQGVYRVLRGGCWKSLKEDLRCSHRHRNNPGTVNSTYGFRCAAHVG